MNAGKIKQFKADPMAFFASIVVESAHGPQLLGDIWAPFQVEWFQAVTPSLLAIERGERPPIGRFFVERTKGGSKDSDIALAILHLLAFTQRPLAIQIGAGDKDQADEPREILAGILRLNPWLKGHIEIQNWKVLCKRTESECEITAADAPGAHGARPDVVFLNELSHIPDHKEEFALTLLDNASKRPRGLVLCATNAGFLGKWQYRLREMARSSERWHFSALSEPVPWMDPRELVEAKQRMSTARYMRLYHGRWATGAGDALDPEDIAICTSEKLSRMFGDEAGFCFNAGLDLGISNDHAALVVVGTDGRSQRLQLASCESWAPGPSGQINLEQVELAVLDAAWRYNLLNVAYDPYQCIHLAQRLQRRGVNMVQVNFTGKNLDAMASLLLQVVRNHMITLYNDAELIRDLGKLMIVEKSYGYRLQAPSDKSGHADRAQALTLALLPAVESIDTWQPPPPKRIKSVLDLSEPNLF